MTLALELGLKFTDLGTSMFYRPTEMLRVGNDEFGNKPIGSVQFAFNYSGDVSGGSPRLSIPINDGTSPTPYAFLDAAGCGFATDADVHTVSTSSSTCQVSFKSSGYNYATWDAFVTANPALRMAKGTLAFVIADQPGHDVIYSMTTE